jgi:hypothetical protein
MEKINRNAIAQACRGLLKPLASYLLKCGMTWREFAEVSKSVFVQIASDEYGLQGRKTNISRVSILTGISRKEVKRQRDLLAGEQPLLPSKTTDATRVLSGWHQDPDFTDSDGDPRRLPFERGDYSFMELCRRYGGDIPASAMLKELKRVGAVVETETGVKAARRYYMPAQFDAQWILNAGSVFADLGANINHNLTATEDDPSWFLGRAANDSIEVKNVSAFRDYLEQQGQAFLERVDAWLTENESRTPREEDAEQRVRLGVGLFLIKREED